MVCRNTAYDPNNAFSGTLIVDKGYLNNPIEVGNLDL